MWPEDNKYKQMAYTINKTDGTVIATITDGTIDTSTSLTLFGKSYSGFGELLNENLVKLLENSQAQFIMHYARQDLLWLKYHLKASPKNIFCTKVASKIARTASSSHGYKDLVKEICRKDISKKEQQSDWGDPNLSPKQISYAAQDTEFLFEIKKKLTNMLEREKRIELYEKSIKVLPTLVDMEMAGYKISTFEH